MQFLRGFSYKSNIFDQITIKLDSIYRNIFHSTQIVPMAQVKISEPGHQTMVNKALFICRLFSTAFA